MARGLEVLHADRAHYLDVLSRQRRAVLLLLCSRSPQTGAARVNPKLGPGKGWR